MWEWIWNNLSNIDSILNILFAILSVCAFIGGLIVGVLQLKLKRNQYKYLNLVADRQTKQSMKYYVPTRAQDIDPNTEEDSQSAITKKLVPFFIDEIFNKSDDQYFIILADSGMGKTTFLLSLFFKYYKKIFRKFNIAFVPLALDCSIEKIRQVNKKSATILLLDGFDEDQYAMEDYANRLIEICNETELFYKVIITCRTQFFSDCDSEPKYIGGKIKFGVGKKSIVFKKYYISPFNNKEVDLYLKKKYNIILERNKIERSKKIIANCPKLIVRPMLLAAIDDLIMDERKNYDYAYEIYSELVSKWIERESIDDKLLYDFSEKIAENMFLCKTTYIEEREIENLCKKYNIQINTVEAKSRSLLNRNANGKYKFAHKSILEYFIAVKAYNDFEFRKRITQSGFLGYDVAKFFLGEMDTIYLEEILQGNPIELNSYNFSCLQFPNVNLSNIIIKNCSFERCNLSNANFKRTKLINVNFGGSQLINANFKDSYLKDIKFRRTNLRETSFREASLIDVKFDAVYLDKISFKEAYLSKVNFEGKNLREVNLCKTYLNNIDLHGKRFYNVIMDETIFEDVNLIGTRFVNSIIDMTLIRVYLEEMVFEKSRINCFKLKNTDLKCIHFFNNEIPIDSEIFLDNALISIELFWNIEVALGDKIGNCRIDMGDYILSYEEYIYLRKQKENEWKEEILNIIATGRNYAEKV